MKKTLILSLSASLLLLTSCGGTQGSAIGSGILSQIAANHNGTSTDATTSATSVASSATSSTTTSLVSNLLSSLLGSSSTLTEKSLVGTWNYTGAACVFESENLLAQAGGAVAATKVEEQIDAQFAKLGVKAGYSSFTFGSDNTFSATINGKTISGTYTLNTSKKTVTLKFLGGLTQMSAQVTVLGSQLELLFETDKLLKLASTLGAVSGSSTISTLTSLLGSYDGMLVGMKLKK